MRRDERQLHAPVTDARQGEDCFGLPAVFGDGRAEGRKRPLCWSVNFSPGHESNLVV
jgi:hypothetical protein